MNLVQALAVSALAVLAAACEGRADENIAAAAEEQTEGMVAQAANEIEAAGDAIAKGASEIEAEVDPGSGGEARHSEGTNRQ